ncbi:MAG: aldose 1-epimerase family protein [Eubacteriales bacterium]|nr:aldose 1-epimerase family protein [Eubacteriales bacterium]
MACTYIENEAVRICVNHHGAELVSIVRKKDGEELMWCGDSAYWGRVSPVLFPFVGKLNGLSYSYGGSVYDSVPQHGWARDCDFVLTENAGDSLWFELRPDEAWAGRYPFKFLLRAGYRLEGSSVHVMWNVINEDDKELYFSIGAHPAFAAEGGLAGWKLDLNNGAGELTYQLINKSGCLAREKYTKELEGGCLALSDELFDNDALILDGKGINTVALIDPKGVKRLQLRFDAPQLGIWSPVGKHAPFVCIEPWFGRCDAEDFTGTLEQREFGNQLAPGHSFNKEYVIDCFDC